MAPSLQPGALARSVKNVSSTAPVMFGPNITGRFHGVDDIATGAFFFPNQERGSVRGGEDVWIHNVEIDASRVSSVYDNAETVQPQAVRFLACIKH